MFVVLTSPPTQYILRQTVLQVKKINKQYQSRPTEGKNATKVKKTKKKQTTQNTAIQ